MIQVESEKAKYTTLVNRLIKEGSTLQRDVAVEESDGSAPAPVESAAAKDDEDGSIRIVPLSKKAKDNTQMLQDVTSVIRSLAERDKKDPQEDSKWPTDIDHLAHRIDIGQIAIDDLPIELVEIYFKLHEIKNSTLPLDLSKAHRFVWTEYQDRKELTYECAREELEKLPHVHNTYTHLPFNKPAVMEFLTQQVGKTTQITCHNNYFTLSIEGEDQVIYGNKILINKFGIKLLVFSDICTREEFALLPQEPMKISSAIMGDLEEDADGAKVFAITLLEASQTEIHNCTDSLKLQLYYGNVKDKLTRAATEPSDEAAASSPPHTEIVSDIDLAALSGKLDATEMLGDLSEHDGGLGT